MAVRIRLQRQGKPKRPFYKMVAIDGRAKRDGEPIEVLGQYDPMSTGAKLTANKERIEYWIKQGAIPSDTAANLIKKLQ